MSLFSEHGRNALRAFTDWVNAESLDIPPEIVYPPKADDHGHGHDDHGHDDHGHDDHGHDDHGHDAHEEHHEEPVEAVEEAHAEEAHAEAAEEPAHEEHGGHDDHGHGDHHETPHIPQPSREEARAAADAEIEAREEAKRAKRAEKIAAAQAAKEAKYGKQTEQEPGVFLTYRGIAAFTGMLLAAILIVTVAFLPRFGEAAGPAVNEVSQHYLEKALPETGAVNSVAGIILDYRAFDTLGESMVLFTATVAIIFLLSQFKRSKTGGDEVDNEEHRAGMRSLPARVIFAMTIPFILLYGVYIVINGHLSPGGGFSGGTILGGALILLHLVFGEKYAERFITLDHCKKIMAAGLFAYIALKSYSILTGANGIESVVPLGKAGSIFSAGLIFPLNICVGLIVMCTMYSLYHLFTSWKA